MLKLALVRLYHIHLSLSTPLHPDHPGNPYSWQRLVLGKSDGGNKAKRLYLGHTLNNSGGGCSVFGVHHSVERGLAAMMDFLA